LLNFQLNDAFLLTLLLVGQPAMAERVRQITQLDDRLSARGIVRALERREVGEADNWIVIATMVIIVNATVGRCASPTAQVVAPSSLRCLRWGFVAKL
jgi:hypothetical protein